MPLNTTHLPDSETKESGTGRLRLAHPGKFFARLGMLAACVAVLVLTVGYLREAGRINGPGGLNAGSSTIPAVRPTPVSTPSPIPTPAATPPPAPEGYVWQELLVVLDPGHGGRDPGTCTSDESLQEKEVTLDVALRCAALLEAEGIPVLLTRSEDVALADTVKQDLAARSRLANMADATLYISIHVNSLELSQRGAADVKGLECYYRDKEPVYDALDDEWLATHIGDVVSATTENLLLGVYPRSLAVLRETDMPAMLLEIGYLTNQEDEARLRSDAYRQRVAEGVARGAADAVALLEPRTFNNVQRVLKKLPAPTPLPAADGMETGSHAQPAGENGRGDDATMEVDDD